MIQYITMYTKTLFHRVMITSNFVCYHTIIPFDWFAFIWCSFVVEVAGKGILGALASFLVLRIISSGSLEVTGYRYMLFLYLYVFPWDNMTAIPNAAQSTVFRLYTIKTISCWFCCVASKLFAVDSLVLHNLLDFTEIFWWIKYRSTWVLLFDNLYILHSWRWDGM